MKTGIKTITNLGLAILIGVACFFCSKQNGPLAVGGGSETSNGLTGKIVTESGTLETGTSISIHFIDSFYLTLVAFSETTETDQGGQFFFDSLPPGLYNLLVQDTTVGLGVFIRNILVDSVDIVDLGVLRLLQLGDIIGNTTYGDGRFLPGAFILIKGTPMNAKSDSLGNFHLSGVPPAEYNLSLEYVFPPEYNSNSGQRVSASVPGIRVSEDSIISIGPINLE